MHIIGRVGPTDLRAASSVKTINIEPINTSIVSGFPTLWAKISGGKRGKYRAVDIAKSHGLKVKALMSIGHAGESEESIENTKNWLLEKGTIIMGMDHYLENLNSHSWPTDLNNYRNLIDEQKFDQYLKNIWIVISNANKYIDEFNLGKYLNVDY